MYLGGMAGTGKSQVIKAVTKYFEDIGQSGKMVLLAPTGSAAALIGGSTYHSYLGFRENNKQCTQTCLAKLSQKVANVKYIFIDEVSMISCMDLYKISAQLAILRNESQEPFGGLNMIFAGDFAQLPPVGTASPLYAHLVKSNSKVGQKIAIGKALWHQTTTVVILRQNMRQRSQTNDDARLRRALENMRYKSCTVEDIQYLTELCHSNTVKHKMKDDRFRNVSVITAHNVHRDRINELGSARFAADNNQTLISFYSKDSWPNGPRISTNKKTKLSSGAAKLSQTKVGKIPPSLQKVLWNVTPKSSDHKSGTLRLCKGLPVLIKYNEATECCVTNGAEAHVVDWISYLDPDTQARTLKTLFVKLHNPPSEINITGLPTNVVPISPESRQIACQVPEGSIITIKRSQIPVIPNFAMTDYCSQGRTRPFNVVHLNNCKNHQSYYTCLSRSATHEGTFIINGFNSSAITTGKGNGLGGNIRQEFRELEILDEISKLRYESMLPNDVNGIVRRDLITQFRKWKGDAHLPQHMHNALKLDKQSPFVLSPCEDIQWKIVSGQNKTSENKRDKPVGHKNTSSFVPVQYSDKSTKPTQVPKCDLTSNSALSATHANVRTGLTWDSINWSCAYDSLFTILWNLWNEDKNNVLRQNSLQNNLYFQTLIDGFRMHHNQQTSLESVRDNVRSLLSRDRIQLFPTGPLPMDIKDLFQYMFAHENENALGHKTTFCDNCGMHNRSNRPINHNVHEFSDYSWQMSTMHNHPHEAKDGNTGHCANMYFKSIRINTPCTYCGRNLLIKKHFESLPSILLIHLGTQKMQVSHTIHSKIGTQIHEYRIKGLVYHGDNHFTSAYIDKNQDIWYHDGIATGKNHEYQGSLRTTRNNNIIHSHGKQICTIIYCKV